MAQDSLKSPTPLKKFDSFTLLVILVVVVIGVITIFALGIFNGGKTRKASQPTSGAPTEVIDQQTRDLERISDSDEVPSIEADLNSTNVDNLDQGLNEAVSVAGDL